MEFHISINPTLYDYSQHEDIVNNFFENEEKKLAKIENHPLYVKLDIQKPRRIFWSILAGNEYPHNDIYIRICQYLVCFINLKISEKTNPKGKEDYDLFFNWSEYLLNNIFTKSYFMEYREEKIEKLLNRYPHQQEMLSIFKVINSKPFADFYEILNFDSPSFWNEFVNYYKQWYSIFEKDVKYIGEELAKCDGKIAYRNVKDIFQIKESHESPNTRTPQNLNYDINSLIRELIHIRNAISHDLFKFEDDGKIILWDQNPAGKITYKEIKTKAELLRLVHKIKILNHGIQNCALHFSISRAIAIAIISRDPKKKNMIICPLCKKVTFKFLRKGMISVKCDNCGYDIPIERWV